MTRAIFGGLSLAAAAIYVLETGLPSFGIIPGLLLALAAPWRDDDRPVNGP